MNKHHFIHIIHFEILEVSGLEDYCYWSMNYIFLVIWLQGPCHLKLFLVALLVLLEILV